MVSLAAGQAGSGRNQRPAVQRFLVSALAVRRREPLLCVQGGLRSALPWGDQERVGLWFPRKQSVVTHPVAAKFSCSRLERLSKYLKTF